MAPEVLVFSKVIWDTLPKDDQALIRKAAKDSVPVHAQALGRARGQVAADRRGRRRRRSSPLEDKQAFVDAMEPVYAKFADTPELQDLVKRIQATQ